MKKILIATLLFFSLKISAQSFPDVTQYTLANGLRVYIIPYGEISKTEMTLYVNCGKRNETPGQQYYSQLAANCINFGSQKYDVTTLNDKLFTLGSSINTSAGNIYTSIDAGFLNDSLETGIEIFSESILHPSFPDKEIKQNLSQLVDYNNPAKVDVNQQANIFSNYWVYGSANPFGRTFYKDQLLKVTPAILKEFYEFNFTPKNSRLVICGKIDVAKIKQLVEKYFGPWTATYGEVNGATFDNPVIKKKEYGFINHPGAVQCALQWNKTGPDPNAKEVLAFMAANSQFNNVLFKEIREKGGKTYGISSSYNRASGSNVFKISTMVRSEEMLNTINLFDKTILDFYTNGITDDQLKKTKMALKNNWLMIENPASVIDFFNPMLFPKVDLQKNYLTLVDALTVEEVNKIIKKYFTPDAYKLMIAADEKLVDTQLQQLLGLKKFMPADIQVDQ